MNRQQLLERNVAEDDQRQRRFIEREAGQRIRDHGAGRAACDENFAPNRGVSAGGQRPKRDLVRDTHMDLVS
jgi:hypothetical protein